jgi:hypothetical protein
MHAKIKKIAASLAAGKNGWGIREQTGLRDPNCRGRPFRFICGVSIAARAFEYSAVLPVQPAKGILRLRATTEAKMGVPSNAGIQTQAEQSFQADSLSCWF